MNVHARNAKIINDARHLERIDYVSTNGTEGFYIYDRRNGRVDMHKIKIYDARALFGYEWKDINDD